MVENILTTPVIELIGMSSDDAAFVFVSSILFIVLVKIKQNFKKL